MDPIVPTLRFHIAGLPATPYRHLTGLSDEALAEHHAKRYVVDERGGYPDRIELREADVGESVILVNHAHLPNDGPYRSSHAIFVLEHPHAPFDAVDRIPGILRTRLLSLRAFDRDAMMVDADVVDGSEVESLIGRMFALPDVTYLHAHTARRGCFLCRIDRRS